MSAEVPGELAKIVNCKHEEVQVEIPAPDERKGSSFTFACPLRERGGSALSRLFPERKGVGDVILAVVRDYQTSGKEATLICTADCKTCVNVMPGELDKAEKTSGKKKIKRGYYFSNSLIATHREFKEAKLQK